MVRAAAARDYWQRWEMIDAAFVNRVQGAGGRVIAWTVNSNAAVSLLNAPGGDAVCTDVTDEIVPFVRQREGAKGG